jgi:predicted dehydrogenase
VALDRAKGLAATVPGARATARWEEVVDAADVDLVIVATTNDRLAEVTLAAVRAGRHVLVEKPAARTADELDAVLAACARGKALVRVGFNHRYHPALLKAHELLRAGELGPLMFVRGRYGHGGRPGYDKEWRAQPAVSGGGELLDQGVHLIDLARTFLGDFTAVQGFAKTFFWDMPVEDNGFLLLRTARDQVAFLHASCTEWKNMFSLEVYGRDAKLDVTGLGGSYGVERLAFYKMLPGMGPPATTIWEYPFPDTSWATEFSEFLADIEAGRQPAAGVADAQAALRIVEQVYRESAR